MKIIRKDFLSVATEIIFPPSFWAEGNSVGTCKRGAMDYDDNASAVPGCVPFRRDIDAKVACDGSGNGVAV